MKIIWASNKTAAHKLMTAWVLSVERIASQELKSFLRLDATLTFDKDKTMMQVKEASVKPMCNQESKEE